MKYPLFCPVRTKASEYLPWGQQDQLLDISLTLKGKKLPGGKSQDVRGEGKVIMDENAVEDMSAVNKR